MFNNKTLILEVLNFIFLFVCEPVVPIVLH